MKHVLFVARQAGREGAPTLQDMDRAFREYFGETPARHSRSKRSAPKISDATPDPEPEMETSRLVPV